MAWIESHQTLGDHPKTFKFARILGVSRATAVGHLHYLWWWALEYAQDGDLGKFDPAEVAIAGLWDGEPQEFIDALINAGFLDPDSTIHDWMDYAGRLVQARKRKADGMRKKRDGTLPTHAVTNRTQPYPTVPNQKRTPLPSPEAKDSPLLVPEWLTTFSEVHQPTPEEIGRLNNWAKDHTLEILTKTAREFVLGWPDYHQQYPKRKPIRSFQGWVRVAENGRNASRSPPPDQSVDPTEKYRQEAAKIAARRGEG